MKKNGFTLVELLIYMAVGLIIIAAIYAVTNLAQRSSASTGRKVITTQDARLVLDFMAMDIRHASFRGMAIGNPWQTADANGNPTGAVDAGNGLGGIQFANANTILVQMDLDQSGVIGDRPDEIIRYSYDGVDTITRASNGGPNQAILGRDALGRAFGTLVVNSQAVALGAPACPVAPVANPRCYNLFQYFNSQGGELLPAQLLNPAINQQIRRIRINIAAQTEGLDPLTGRPRIMTHYTDVAVKDHPLAVYSIP